MNQANVVTVAVLSIVGLLAYSGLKDRNSKTREKAEAAHTANAELKKEVELLKAIPKDDPKDGVGVQANESPQVPENQKPKVNDDVRDLTKAVVELKTTFKGVKDEIDDIKMKSVDLKRNMQEAQDALVAREKALKKEADIGKILNSRAWQEYNRDVKWFEDQGKSRMDASNDKFIVNLLDDVSEDESKQGNQDKTAETRKLNYIESMNKIKRRLARHHGFTIEKVKELGKLDRAD